MNDTKPQADETPAGAASELSAGLGAMTHFWCEVCDAIQPTFFEGAHNRDTTGTFVGGDVVCEECRFIIATAYVPNAKSEPTARLLAQVGSTDGLAVRTEG